MSGGVQVLQGAATALDCARWLSITDAALLATATAQNPNRSGREIDAPGAATMRPCSLRLAALPELFDEVRETLQRHRALTGHLTAALGPRRALLIDHCWVRHQPAPRHRAPGQTPHSWHQDGALAFDFSAPHTCSAPPLPMVTCWLPLNDCGTAAPSLVWFDASLDHVLTPEDLAEAAVEARRASAQPPTSFRHAELSAGDALLFNGDLLHRTHATPAMTQARTSVELRWLPADAIPERLSGGHIAVIA